MFWIITADEGVRGGKKIPLKKNTDEALKKCGVRFGFDGDHHYAHSGMRSTAGTSRRVEPMVVVTAHSTIVSICVAIMIT